MGYKIEAIKIPSLNLNFPRYKHVNLQSSFHEKLNAQFHEKISTRFHMERDLIFYCHLVSFPNSVSIYSRVCLFFLGHM
jgi:hypothetical protein